MDAIEALVIGGGPAGLVAAQYMGECGINTILVDENEIIGGQLFKQIHKFFGSVEHHAGERGTEIGEALVKRALRTGVDVRLNSVAFGVFEDGIVGVTEASGKSYALKPEVTLIATGAMEKGALFHGWTLPGVVTVGAFQTFMNIHRTLLGETVLILGGGNVGMIVAYQALQAGAKVAGIVEVEPQVGGYQVHARKLKRAGVPIWTSHALLRVLGESRVESAVIAPLKEGKPVSDAEFEVPTDTVCMSVGLSPLCEMTMLMGCEHSHIAALGGHVALHGTSLETTRSGVFVAGDVAGIGEASTAMEEGKLAASGMAHRLGYVSDTELRETREEALDRLGELRTGVIGQKMRLGKQECLEGYERHGVDGGGCHA